MTSPAPAPPLQQVNLLNPSLLPKRETFSARHIAVWSIVVFVAMAAIGWWATGEIRSLRRVVAEHAARHAEEAALAAVPRLPGGEVAPTQQEVAALEQSLRDRQSLLAARQGARDGLKRGLAGPDAGPSAVLRLMAATVPVSAWLTEVRVAGDRIDIAGKALDAAAVDDWLERLRSSGFLAPAPVPGVRVERIDSPTPSGRVLPVYVFGISAALASPFAEEGGRP
jgi:Tfp pilus assembly protein PilN